MASSRLTSATLGTDKRDLLAHHFGEADRGLADTQVDQFGECVEFQVVQDDVGAAGSRLSLGQVLHGRFQKFAKRLFGQGLRQESRAYRAGAVEDFLLAIRGDHRDRHAWLRLAKLGGQIEAVCARAY